MVFACSVSEMQYFPPFRDRLEERGFLYVCLKVSFAILTLLSRSSLFLLLGRYTKRACLLKDCKICF